MTKTGRKTVKTAARRGATAKTRVPRAPANK